MQLLYIDLFCGAGGTSTGVENARINNEQCAKVIACVNHDANAIASHAANHPDALHFIEDIRTLKLEPLISHLQKCREEYPEALVVLWASLECTNFSKAKGGQPRDADSRTLAEHLFRYIQAINPDYIQIENVEEFMAWGPIDSNGKPISMHKGEDYTRWIDRVQHEYGKHADKMDSKHYDEWYSIMRKEESLKKVYNFDHRILNSADFGAYTSRKRFFGIFAKCGLPIIFPEPTHAKKPTSNKQAWKAVRDVLDFDDEGKSIFGRKTPLVDPSLLRIHAGLVKFVAGGKEAFMVKYNSMSRTGKYIAPSVDDPCPVVSTQNRLGIARVNFLSKYFSGHPDSKNASIDEPAGAIACKDHHSFITAYYGGSDHNYSIGSPSPTLTTKDRLAFISTYYGNGGNHSVNNPAPTVTTKDRFSLVESRFMCSYNFKDNAKDINKPCPTILTKDRLSLISSHFIDQQYGNSKPASPDRPLGCITANPKFSLVSCKPWLMDTGFNNIGTPVNSPSPVITANRKWHYLMNPQFKSAGGSIDKPCFTLIARMDKMPPYLIEASGEGELPSFIKAIPGGFIYEIYDTDTNAMKQIKEFMALYGILDIKMRMLKIPELKRIMGFPEDYQLIGTKAEQKKFIGNAVEVNMARVLCEALCNELLIKQYQAA